MKITEWFFAYILVPLFLLLGAAYYDGGQVRIISAAVALFGGLTNFALIVPNALKAGKASVAERKGKDSEGSLKKFAVEGGAVSELLNITIYILLHFIVLERAHISHNN